MPLLTCTKTTQKRMVHGLVLLGFTFFTATMWAGGSVGVAFDFSTMLMILIIGN